MIVCLAYAPDCNLLLSANESAGVSLNIFVIVGYFFIITVQLLGALGDKNAMPVTVRSISFVQGGGHKSGP